jgi:hypothetical protein
MKKCLVIIVSLMCFGTSMAQIQITPYIDENNCSVMPDGICEILTQKLNNIISQNGIQSQMGQSRFVLTCNVTEESKNVLSTSPTQIAYVLDLHLYIGDGETGTKYISQSFRTKGVGVTEEKAYRNAVKNMQAKSDQMTAFIGKGKARIIDYYENNKEQILSSIRACADGKNFEQSAYELCLIPQECSYYNDIQTLLGKVNGRIVDNKSSDLFLQAKSVWASEQNESTANQVADLITKIDANASCYAEANKFMEAVTVRMEQLNNREWAARQRQLAHEREMEMVRENNRSAETKMRIKAQRDTNIATVRAVRDVAIEYAKRRPRVVYHVYGWY